MYNNYLKINKGVLFKDFVNEDSDVIDFLLTVASYNQEKLDKKNK